MDELLQGFVIGLVLGFCIGIGVSGLVCWWIERSNNGDTNKQD